MIKLIINADDFGMSKVFNEKILGLLEKGFIKSTTVMVNRITEEQRAQIARLSKLKRSRSASVGLHLELDPTKTLMPQIAEQHNRFVSIFGSQPSHLDIHKIVDNAEVIKEVNSFAEEKQIPARNHGIGCSAKHTTQPAFYCSGWVMNMDELAHFLEKLEDGNSYEIISHPGEFDPESKSSLNRERKNDYECIVKLQEFLKRHKNIKNASYLEL